jgi:hypothetical protein
MGMRLEEIVLLLDCLSFATHAKDFCLIWDRYETEWHVDIARAWADQLLGMIYPTHHR